MTNLSLPENHNKTRPGLPNLVTLYTKQDNTSRLKTVCEAEKSPYGTIEKQLSPDSVLFPEADDS